MPADSTKKLVELDAAARAAATHLAESPRRVPSTDVARLLIHRFALDRRQARAVIRGLVKTGALSYAYDYGCSFLEPSFRKPVRVGERVVLVPADQPYQAVDQEVAVHIASGASFGCGRHPTTQLAIQGIEQALNSVSPAANLERSTVLDIGTGSGVLVIAAVMLGVSMGVGIDTDPCARVEAHQNVKQNRLADKIEISDQPLDKIKPSGRFFIALANLRLPTLLAMAAPISRLSMPSSLLVLSGLRVEEMDGLLDVYRGYGFHPLWIGQEKGWGAVVCDRQVG